MLYQPSKFEPPTPRETVLIVEDEVISRRALGAILRQAGYLTESAATAEQALVQSAGGAPSVALVDVDLPGMNGVDLVDLLSHQRPDATFILITSWPYDELPSRPISDHVHYMQKPINVDHLLRLIGPAVKTSPFS